MDFTIQPAYRRLLEDELQTIRADSRFDENLNFMQHGTVSVYQHCVSVAYVSCLIAQNSGMKIDYPALIRGALLHDYFLYDWHDASGHHHLHGFRHPYSAWKNASRDFNLTPVEENIILRHMFPLTAIPPQYTEAWIVCMADKYCAALETMHLPQPCVL